MIEVKTEYYGNRTGAYWRDYHVEGRTGALAVTLLIDKIKKGEKDLTGTPWTCPDLGVSGVVGENIKTRRPRRTTPAMEMELVGGRMNGR